MVLQQDQAIPIWGWTNRNEKMAIQFNKQMKTTRADKESKWRIDLHPESTGGTYS